jgi:hypothetical protein
MKGKAYYIISILLIGILFNHLKGHSQKRAWYGVELDCISGEKIKGILFFVRDSTIQITGKEKKHYFDGTDIPGTVIVPDSSMLNTTVHYRQIRYLKWRKTNSVNVGMGVGTAIGLLAGFIIANNASYTDDLSAAMALPFVVSGSILAGTTLGAVAGSNSFKMEVNGNYESFSAFKNLLNSKNINQVVSRK